MQSPPPLIQPHSFARLIAWARCALMWVMQVLAGRTPPLTRRCGRGLFNPDAFARFVAKLVLIRAAERSGRRPTRRQRRAHAATGFRQRIAPSGALRAATGAALRRFLKRGDGAERFAHLLDALQHIDALAAKLLRRLRRGLTRLRPLIATRPPMQPLRVLCDAAPRCADSS